MIKKTSFAFLSINCVGGGSILTSTILFTSCAAPLWKDVDNDPEPTSSDQQHYDYIYDRTFSIAATNDTHWVRGTAWLFYHINDVTNHYRYYAMTNSHVTLGIKNLGSSVSYGIWKTLDDSVNNHANGWDSYIKTGITIFMSSSTPANVMYYSNATYKQGIDASFFEIDFTNSFVANQSNAYWKNSLDNINAFAGAHDKYTIEKYAPPYSNNFTHENMYLAGYPSMKLNGNYTRWARRKSKIKESHLNYFSNKRENHSIGSDGPTIIYSSIADFYVFNDQDFHLRGGSSGSMIINDANELVGIYWGISYIENPNNPDDTDSALNAWGVCDLLISYAYNVFIDKFILN